MCVILLFFKLAVTESQNGCGWNALLYVNPLLKQGHLQLFIQDHTQVAFEELQGGDPTTSRQPVPVLHHLHSNKVIPGVQRNLLCSSLCLLPVVLAWGTT